TCVSLGSKIGETPVWHRMNTVSPSPLYKNDVSSMPRGSSPMVHWCSINAASAQTL
ncbi:hypothetical protein HAX54_010914, partial [Datura stramonium]|nr:hypothetical protein [Datura stramonium]